MLHDLILRHATIIAGDNTARYPGDIAITGERITGVGDLAAARGRSEVYVTGMVVAPGFIDVHTHDDTALLQPHGMDAKISQGVTSVIAGNCGISVAPLRFDGAPPPPFTLVGDRESFRFDRFADYVDAPGAQGTATNAALLVGHVRFSAARSRSGCFIRG